VCLQSGDDLVAFHETNFTHFRSTDRKPAVSWGAQVAPCLRFRGGSLSFGYAGIHGRLEGAGGHYTIANLDKSASVSAKHVAEAVRYRSLDRNYWSWEMRKAESNRSRDLSGLSQKYPEIPLPRNTAKAACPSLISFPALDSNYE
jgi:hypothetical protein